MSEVLSPAQPYIQLEEAMKASSIHSAKLGDGGGKSKSPHDTPDYTQDRHRRQLAYKKQALPILSKLALKRQFDGMLHSVEASDEQNLQHYQRSIMGQAPETTPTQSLALHVAEMLLIPRRQEISDHPLLGPPEVPRGACETRLPQGIYPHSGSHI